MTIVHGFWHGDLFEYRNGVVLDQALAWLARPSLSQAAVAGSKLDLPRLAHRSDKQGNSDCCHDANSDDRLHLGWVDRRLETDSQVPRNCKTRKFRRDDISAETLLSG